MSPRHPTIAIAEMPMNRCFSPHFSVTYAPFVVGAGYSGSFAFANSSKTFTICSSAAENSGPRARRSATSRRA